MFLITRAIGASLRNVELNAVPSSLTSGIRALRQAPFPQARPRRSADDELKSTIFCYSSLDRPAARAAVDAVNAILAIDFERDFVASRPVVLGAVHEAVVREHTADRKRTVFQVRLTRKSALSVGSICALVGVLRRGFPDLLMLWDNELRL